MRRLVSIDPGTAGLGFVTGESDGVAHRVLDIDVFESAPRAAKYSYAQHDDRVRRTRELHQWMRPKLFPPGLASEAPVVVAVEAMSFPPDPHAVAMMCLAWGVIISLLEERVHYATEFAHPVAALFEVQPTRWRTYLIGHPAIGKRKPTERVMRQVVAERERASQLEALRRFPEAVDLIDRISPELRVHGLDGLGVFAWAVADIEVRRLMSIGRVNG